jgi:ABC-type multidrug transport system fused ATPase/permease subunit
MVITAIIEASVAVGRLTAFLTAEELQPHAVIRRESAKRPGDEVVRVHDATFAWDRNGDRKCLENISFTARKGELSCIVGRVGAGKSSFLEAILGNIWKIKGEVVVRGRIAYVAQQPWVSSIAFYALRFPFVLVNLP